MQIGNLNIAANSIDIKCLKDMASFSLDCIVHKPLMKNNIFLPQSGFCITFFTLVYGVDQISKRYRRNTKCYFNTNRRHLIRHCSQLSTVIKHRHHYLSLILLTKSFSPFKYNRTDTRIRETIF